MKNDTKNLWTVRRMGAVALAPALALVLACGGCSSAERTTARGWEFGSGESAAPAPSSTGERSAATAQTNAPAAQQNSTDGVGTPYGALAVTTDGETDFFFGDLPSTDITSSASMMLDGMESLSQVTFTGEGASFDPCISRDGSVMVFASTQHRPTADIYLKPVHGRTVTQLTADPAHDIMPAISPDGQRVAFASNRTGSWDIFVMSSTGGKAVQLTNDPARELHPSWSPDGTKLVFCRLGEVSGRWEMWVMDLAKGTAAEFIGYGLFPRWCPVPGTGEDGRDKIAFQRSRERGDRAFSIWTVDYRPGDVTSPTEIVSSTREALINPNWSADGQWITYASVPLDGGALDANGRPASADLWIASVNGFGQVNLTSGNFVNLAPAWGPDNRLYFVSNRGGNENIWSIGIDKALAAATGQLPGRVPGQGEANQRGTAQVPTP